MITALAGNTAKSDEGEHLLNFSFRGSQINNQPVDPVDAKLIYGGINPAIALTYIKAINHFPFGRNQNSIVLRSKLNSVQLEAFRVDQSGTQAANPSYRVFLDFDSFGRVERFRTTYGEDFRYSYQGGLISEIEQDGATIFTFDGSSSGFKMVYVQYLNYEYALPPTLKSWFPADPSWEASVCEGGACYKLLGNHIVQVSYEPPDPRIKNRIYINEVFELDWNDDALRAIYLTQDRGSGPNQLYGAGMGSEEEIHLGLRIMGQSISPLVGTLTPVSTKAHSAAWRLTDKNGNETLLVLNPLFNNL